MKILLVDDHHLVRDGVRPVLAELAGPGETATVLEAASLAGALELAAAHPDLDLALVDLRLPDVRGFDALSRLQQSSPGLPIVVMSGDDDPAVVREALGHGALGFIPKSSPRAVILNALRLVLSGGTYIPREAMGAAAAPSTQTPAAGAGGAAALGLTPRQADVLALLLAGKSNKLICRELNLAEGTVKNHVAAVFKALDVTTRVQAVIAAAKLGIKP
jgi:DNA-binding NarL/FixJ family response regulator